MARNQKVMPNWRWSEKTSLWKISNKVTVSFFWDGFTFECCHFYHVVVYYSIYPPPWFLTLCIYNSHQLGMNSGSPKNSQSFPPIEQRWWSHNLTLFLEAFYCVVFSSSSEVASEFITCQCYTSEEKQKENVRNTKRIQKKGSSFGEEEFETGISQQNKWN